MILFIRVTYTHHLNIIYLCWWRIRRRRWWINDVLFCYLFSCLQQLSAVAQFVYRPIDCINFIKIIIHHRSNYHKHIKIQNKIFINQMTQMVNTVFALVCCARTYFIWHRLWCNVTNPINNTPNWCLTTDHITSHHCIIHPPFVHRCCYLFFFSIVLFVVVLLPRSHWFAFSFLFKFKFLAQSTVVTFKHNHFQMIKSKQSIWSFIQA